LGPVFALHRLVWRRYRDGWLSLPGTDPVRTFADRATAEATARDLEWGLRGRVNPFRCGGPRLHYQTAFDAARLFDWCLDHGLDPPGVTDDSGVWAAWWESHKDGFTPAQRAAVWEVLDLVRFYRVEEAEPAEPMHLVALPHFENDPVPAIGAPERYVGCTPHMLARARATADGLCRHLATDRLIESGEYWRGNLNEASWKIPDEDPFVSDEGEDEDSFSTRGMQLLPEHGLTFFAEHRPLGLASGRPPTPGRDLFVVLRRSWRIEEGGLPGSWRWCPTHARTCGRAVAAFGIQAAADAHMAKLEAEARQYPSPFRFGNHLEWGTLHASGAWGVLSEMAPINFTGLWQGYTGTDQLWNDWWDAAVAHLSAEQVETAWSLFENLRFYEVVAVEFRE
jgi:hypothetical protein